MNSVRTVIRKELRGYFLSPVAGIFLGVFLLATLFCFFSYSRFFARNIADVRPLFSWLPVLLIFLVSAVTMRAWSEEEKSGTLEVLLTLPVRSVDLVLGKFLAGMMLVGLALCFTLALPLTVAWLGDLDWGPVIGGYLGSMLLAAAYMALGLCVSARTDNQIVSLMVTGVLCAVLFMVGSDTFVSFFGDRVGEVLRAIGTGSRFASIERGVIDLRDIVYYAGLAGLFLLLNVEFLELKRSENSAPAGRARIRARQVTAVLAMANVLLLNVWLSPVASARWDLTESGNYSLSPATETILARLDEPLRISGYFSDRTHPLLAPLVPQVRDMLREYEIRGRGRVQVEILNPNLDEELEETLAQAYDIRTVPFRISGRHEESVVNSYFHVLLRYADRYEVLAFEELIEVDARETEINVRLRNLEYDLTRTVKQLSDGFQSIDSVLAAMDTPAKLTAYVTRDTLPEEFAEVPDRIEVVAEDLVARGNGNFEFAEVDPTGSPELMEHLFRTYNFRPTSVSLFGGDTYYLYLLFETEERIEAVVLQGELTEAAIRSTVESSIKRSVPGFLRKVAILTEKPEEPELEPGMPPHLQPPRQQPDYRLLEQTIQGELRVERVQLEEGVVPGDIDVLLVARPGELTDTQRYAVDQYLMRGGAVIVLAGSYDVRPEAGGIAVSPADESLLEQLETWGVKVENGFVLDSRNARFPVPIQEMRGGIRFQRIHYLDYPFFVDMRGDGINRTHPATAGLQNVVLNWGSALKVDPPENVQMDVLLASSDEAWLHDTRDVLPRTLDEAEGAFPPGSDLESRIGAVAMKGRFPSFFAGKPSPLDADADSGSEDTETPVDTGDSEGDAGADSTADAANQGRTLVESVPDARLSVVGSSAFAADLVKSLGDQAGAAGGVYRGNLQFVRNLIDWSVQDTELLEIRASGAFARTLEPTGEGEKTRIEVMNYAVVLLGLGLVLFAARVGRRRVQPISLEGLS